MTSTLVPPSPPALPTAVTRVFGVHPFHTDGDLLALAFAPDGGLWSVEEPGVLRHWDVHARRQLDWHHFEDLATLWCFSPGARHVASASDDLSVWEVATGELAASWAQPAWVTAVAFRPDATILAAGSDDGVVRLWDWTSKRLVRQLDGHDLGVSALAFSSDGRRLAAAGEDKIIRLWDVETGAELGRLVGHTDRIPSLAWHPDGRRLASAGWDTTARLWDVNTFEPIILLNSHVGQVHTLAFNPDGSLLACADSANTVRVWDAVRCREVCVLPEIAGEIRCVAFTPDGQRLAAAGTDRIIHLWDARQTPEQERLADPHLTRTCVAVSPDGRRLTSLAAGLPLRVWDADADQPARGLEDADVLHASAASPDGRWIAASKVEVEEGDDLERRSLGLWDAVSGRRQAVMQGQAGPVTALAFAADSTLLATGSFHSCDVWLWGVPNGEPVLLIPSAADDCSIEALAFHPHQHLLAVGGVDWLATGGTDGRLALWDVTERRQVAVFKGGAAALGFDPSGRRLAVATLNRSVRVWDVAEKTLAAEWSAHIDAITSVAYSPDGRLLATGGDDHAVRLWDPETGRALGALELDTQIKALCFSPDGLRLFTGNGNGSCYQLDVGRLLD